MKRLLSKLSLLLLILVLLTACSSKALPNNFDEEKVKVQAENIVTLFSNNEYEKIVNEFTREDIKASLTSDVLSKAKAQVMLNAGPLDKFSQSSVMANKDKDGNNFVSAIIIAKYSNQTVTYTISFDENMKIIGFYLK